MLHPGNEYWVNYIKYSYAKSVSLYVEALTERLLPTFENLSEEADQFAKSEEQRIGISFNPDYHNPADFSEIAHEASREWYINMSGVKQSIVNLFSVGLRHMFEQQLFHFAHYAIRSTSISADYKKNKMVIEMELGIHFEELSPWDRIEELRLACNTVKHAEGSSAKELKAKRQDVFSPSTLKGLWGSDESPVLQGKVKVFQPMAGEDLYLKPGDVNAYGEAIKSFWYELAEKIAEQANSLDPNNSTPFLGE
jgi:hypothetical protein